MSGTYTSTDFLIVGAGIVGLTIAQELSQRYPGKSIAVLEKENQVGLHGSGRNSGVLHSGIYYPPDSYKAKFSDEGRRALTEFCQEHRLPFRKIGKILVPARPEDDYQLDVLYERGGKNGVVVERLNEDDLRRLEPEARSASGRALFVPETSVANPRQVIEKLASLLERKGVTIHRGVRIQSFDSQHNKVVASNQEFHYGLLINAAGLHADRVAHAFGVGKDYTLLPFKGLYWKLDRSAGIRFNHLVYPVPDLRVPFLGVHTTTNTEGDTYLGPTAVPAFSRENYHAFQNVSWLELLKIIRLVGIQFLMNRDGFRRLAWQEGRRFFKPWFVQAAQSIVPRLNVANLKPCDKVGIRAQMLHIPSGRLANDFVVERGQSSIHILNAISPAWTCSTPFAKMVVDQYLQ